jgi:hypothetical protein
MRTKGEARVHDLDVMVAGGGPKGISLAIHLWLSGVRDLLLVERGDLVNSWDSAVAGTSPTRTGMHFSDTIMPGESGVGTLYEFARGVLPERHLAEDHLPKEVLQHYYRLAAQSTGLAHRTGCALRFVEPLVRGGFRVILNDGEELTTRCLVDATGIVDSRRWPSWVSALPPHKYWHSIGHGVLNDTSGLRLLLVGGGHATPDIAVRMAERGSDVTVVVRKPSISQQFLPYPLEFLSPSFQARYQNMSIRQRLKTLTHVGGSGPWATPRSYQDLAEAVLRPRNGMGRIDVELSTLVHSVHDTAGGVRAHLSTGQILDVDGVICATGFEAALPHTGALPMPANSWTDRTLGGYPLVDDGYEVFGMPGFFVIGYLAQLGPRGPVDSILAGTQRTTALVSARVRSRLGASAPVQVSESCEPHDWSVPT